MAAMAALTPLSKEFRSRTNSRDSYRQEQVREEEFTIVTGFPFVVISEVMELLSFQWLKVVFLKINLNYLHLSMA